MKIKDTLWSILGMMTFAQLSMGAVSNQKSAAQANNDFGWNLFEKLQQTERKTENILFSPLSAWLALSLTSNGAEEETLDEMQNVLRIKGFSLVDANQSVKALVSQLVKNQGSSEVLNIANAIWVNSDSFDLSAKFQSDASTFFAIAPDQQIVNSESFQSPETLDHINQWVNRSTKGMIPSILSELNPEMATILLNTLYFEGQWYLPFSPFLTSQQDFYRNDGQIKKVAMLQESGKHFSFASNAKYKMISLGFRAGESIDGRPIAGRFQLDLIIPLADSGTVYDLKQLDYQQLLSQQQSETVHVKIPKFKFSYEKTLNTELQAAGMERAFLPDRAQMQGLGTPKSGGKTFISEVLQKTAVELGENGFKAAAVTTVIVGTTSLEQDSAEFIADRPFFLALRDKETGTLLFQGIVADPEFLQE